MTDNEKQFIRTFVDFESNMKSARQYIAETYGVDSELNEDNNYIKLFCEDGKLDVMNLVSAKNFINETFEDGLIDVTIIHPIKFIHALMMLAQILGNSLDKNPDVECLKVRKLLIKRSCADCVHIDGEAMTLAEDIVVDMDRNSLKVVLGLKPNGI